MSKRRCVVDASAVLAWLFKERGEEVVDKVLPLSVLSAVNLAEVLYRADEEGMSTRTLRQDLEALGVTVEPFIDEDARRVQEIRRAARRESIRLSLADCCCLATAARLDLPVVGGDQAWEVLRVAIEVHPFR